MAHKSDEQKMPVTDETNKPDEKGQYPEGISEADRAMIDEEERKDDATFKGVIITSVLLTLLIFAVSTIIALIRSDVIDFSLFPEDEAATEAVTEEVRADETDAPAPVEIVSAPVTEGDFTYVYVEKCYESPRLSDSARITAYSGTDAELTVPASLGGHEVRSIGDGAFRDNSCIVTLTVPDSVIMLGSYAFNSCIALEAVTLGGVTVMGERAFAACHALKSVTLCEGCTMIGTRTFSLCTSLTSVEMPDSMKTVCEFAFASDRALEKVTLGTGLQSLQNNVFMGCDALTTIAYRGTKAQWDALDISDDYIEMKTVKIEFIG